MVVVSLDQLRPGMVLAADLFSPQGRRLAQKGERLDERRLRVCKVWGVTEAMVEEPSGEDASLEAGGSDPDALAQAEQAANVFFSLSDPGLDVVQELRKVYVSRYAKRLERDPDAAQSPPQSPASIPPLGCDAEAIIRQELTLASLPDVFYRVVEALKSPRSSASYVAEVIGQDMSLSAKLLKMVNSPFYGFPNRIDTLPRAVAIVGANQLTNLAMGISVITLFQDVPAVLLDMRLFWRHSIGCGALARLLARNIGIDDAERVFVSGLLHDVGRLVMLRNFPGQAAAVLTKSHADLEPLYKTERTAWGFNHGTLAGQLLKAWRLPQQLLQNVGLHHAPGRADDPRETSILHVADIMAHAMMLGSSGTPVAPKLDMQAWRRLNVSPRAVEHLSRVVDGYVEDLERVFFHDDD
ncbi:MAG: hypothetical protein PWQ57_1093 [Desulfovibrionales bacterium]|nr:hypothetical protein [Desulfovibrionales bacterium]